MDRKVQKQYYITVIYTWTAVLVRLVAQLQHKQNQLVIVLLEYTLQNKKGICVCADKDFFTLAVCHLTLDR